MAILITGGTGLVGSRLLRRFVEAGVDCRALVRPGKELPEGATRVEGDLLEPETLLRAVEGVSAVVHMAAVFRTMNDEEIWRANLDGTKNLVETVRRSAPGARFVMASTGQVYDAGATHPGREGDATHPTMAYPASKIAAEALVRESGLNWSILRLGFVYGDADGHLAAVPQLAGRFNLHPARTYSMVHHRDVARVVEMVLAGAMDGQIVNVCDDAPTTVYEMAEVVGASMPETAEPLLEPWSGRMDGARLRSLGFRPEVPTLRQAVLEGTL